MEIVLRDHSRGLQSQRLFPPLNRLLFSLKSGFKAKENTQKTRMEKEFAIGEKVRIIALPPYVKTAEPMPMLRPPNVIRLGENGTVFERRPGGYWGVRFEKGAYLMESQYIEAVTGATGTVQSEENSPPEK